MLMQRHRFGSSESPPSELEVLVYHYKRVKAALRKIEAEEADSASRAAGESVRASTPDARTGARRESPKTLRVLCELFEEVLSSDEAKRRGFDLASLNEANN